MNNPLVSIVLPTYNGEEYISRAIQSIINQTYTNWELIIVNDCSTDSTLEIINNFSKQDSRIKIINNDKNMKLPASLNRGFKEANGEYYTWTSDDNEYYPEAIEKMVNFLDVHREYGMVYAICQLLNCPKDQIDVWGEIPATVENLLEFSVCAACFLYRKTVAEEVGEYDTNTFLAEDHDYWLRIRLKYKIANINEVLYKYRLHSKSLTSSNKNKARLLGIKLGVKYQPLFLDKCSNNKKYISKKIYIWSIGINHDFQTLNEAKRECKVKDIYKELKYLYTLEQDSTILKMICSLGFLYKFKAIKLFLKGGRIS